jgi:pimeloyl-ACP methyl ester carboxylesterase
MLASNRRILVTVAAMSAAMVLAACSPTQNGEPSPPPASKTFKAEYNPATLRLPFPNDAFFAGSTDGTLNLPVETAQYYVTTMRTELNTLDGWGTSAPMNTLYDAPIDGSTISGATVHIIEMYLQNATKMPATGAPELPAGATSPISRVLQYGTDFTAEVSPDYDSYGKILRITPLKPLRASTGYLNIGYYVILTKGIKDTSGRASTSDDFYQMLKDAPADCSSLAGDATAYALCGWTKAQLSIGQAVGIDPASVAVSWSFTTQSVRDSFSAIAALAPAQAIGVVPTGLNTAAVGLYGKADIYAGTTQVPYYLTAPTGPADAAAAVLSSYWHGPGGSYITRFNPMPVATSTQTIPLLVTVPNSNAAGGACTKPPAGWPVAIVQHGITGNRTQALAMADSFADACFIVAAIDLPLHGLTDTTNPLYSGPIERTFNVDLVNNGTGASGPDGKIDSSGTHFINLASPLTGRDNLREAEADLITFTKSLANLDIDGGGSDIDPTRIHYVGLSLGSIVGAAIIENSGTRTATLAVPGGVVTKLLLDSQTFGPVVRAGLTAAGLVPNSTLFNNRILRDFQTVVDSGDPINHICACTARQPVHLIEVTGDTVVPNNSTQRLVVAGNMTQLKTAGPHPVATGAPAWVKFSAGSHGSLFDPTASLAATVEMQSQAVQFAASATAPGGPYVVITDTSVISQ